MRNFSLIGVFWINGLIRPNPGLGLKGTDKLDVADPFPIFFYKEGYGFYKLSILEA